MIEWANEFPMTSSHIVINVDNLPTHILIVPTMLAIFYLSNVIIVQRNFITVVLRNVKILFISLKKNKLKKEKPKFLMEQNSEKGDTKHIIVTMNYERLMINS